jgi:hypothetical protein
MDDMSRVWRRTGSHPLAAVAGIGIGNNSAAIDPLLVKLAEVMFHARELRGAWEVGTVNTFDAYIEADRIGLSPNKGVIDE